MNFLFVVPTLNPSELEIEKLVYSLINQTYKKWNLLLIDGYSNEKIIKKFDNFSRMDQRIKWKYQDKETHKIYGAMNTGINNAGKNDWIIFWGSDDWASSFSSLEQIIESINIKKMLPDLLIARGEYSNSFKTNTIKTNSNHFFDNYDYFETQKFRDILFFGKTPIHQVVIFSPKIIRIMKKYDEKYELASDLDCFLNISRNRNLIVKSIDVKIVSMGVSGVSSSNHFQRFQEVYSIYRKYFGFMGIFSFVLRYINRLFALFI